MDSVTEDPYLWLEDITGDDALDWVREHNAPTLGQLQKFCAAKARCHEDSVRPQRCVS